MVYSGLEVLGRYLSGSMGLNEYALHLLTFCSSKDFTHSSFYISEVWGNVLPPLARAHFRTSLDWKLPYRQSMSVRENRLF
jgi:hypothetical protein